MACPGDWSPGAPSSPGSGGAPAAEAPPETEGPATARGAAPPAELRARVVASGHAARVLRDPSVPAGVPVGAEHAGTWRDGDVTCWSRSAAEAAELL